MKTTYLTQPHCIILFLMLFFSFTLRAQQSISTNTTLTATQMAQKLTAPGNTISNATLTGCTGSYAYQKGSFVETNTALPIDSGIVLTTGSAATGILNQIYSSFANTDLPTPGDAQLNGIAGGPTYDACVLQFDVYTVFDSLKFFYSFASEEWPEWACTGYNDAFAFFISGPGIPGQVNLAVIPGTSTPITINSMHFAYGACPALNTQYMINNMIGSNKPVYDQFTTRLKAARNVTPCNTYHIKLAIADGLDGTYDSGVFLETGSFETYGVSSSSSMMIGTDPIAVEGCQDATFTFTRSTNAGTTTLSYTIGGSALNTADYATLSGSVTFAPGVSSIDVTVDAVADGIAEGMEDVKVYLIPTCSGVAYDSAIVDIYDNIDADIAPVAPSCPGMGAQLNGSSLNTDNTATYSWAPAGSLSNPNIANPFATPAVTTTYTMTVTQGPCTDTATVVVAISAAPTADAGTDVTICQGSSTQLNGVSNGDIITWSPSTGLSDPNILNPIATPGTTTTYTLTAIMTSTGCSETDVVTVTVQPLLTPFAGFDLNLCLNDTIQLNGTVPAGYTTYSWSPATGLSDPNILNPLAYPVITTTYVLTASDGICTTTDQLTITINQPQQNNAGPDVTICTGTSTQLNGSSSYPGNSWSPSATLDNPNILNPNATPVTSTTYTLTSTDNVCTVTDQVTVTLAPLISSQINADTNICVGDTIFLNAVTTGSTYYWYPANMVSNPNSLSTMGFPVGLTTFYFVSSNGFCTDTVSVDVQSIFAPPVNAGPDQSICLGQTAQLNGSTFNPNYVWSPANTLNDPNILNPVASPVTTTTYTLTGDNGSCFSTDSITITVQAAPAVDAGVDLITCTGDSIQLQGVSPYPNNTWSPAGFVSQPSNLTSLATPNATMDFILTGTDGLCTDTDTMTITVVPTLTVNAGNDQTICAGDTVQLNANTNGIPTIVWTPATGLSNPNIANPLAYPSTTTIYTATISAGSCTATDDLTITVNPSPTVTVTADQAICAGDNVQLQANGATTYSWTPATGLSASNIANPVASPVVTTTYVVTGTTAGCSDNTTVTVTVNPLPTVNAGPDLNICNGSMATISGSTNGTIILWTPATGLSATNIATPDANPTTTTNYILTVTDANGCTNTDAVTVTVNNIIVDANPDVSLIILGESVTLFASGGVFFMWTPPTGLDNPTAGTVVATPADTTIYIVEVTDANGCIGYDTVIVNVVPDFSIFVPNAFTPNGDGKNDVLHLLPFGSFELLSFQIFNRWGELVYETDDINAGWDGIYKGFEQEVGSYAYYIKARNPLDKLTEFKGNVTLVR